jgi:hypothetical protein
MKRTWPILGVADVPKSTAWYKQLLNARNTHPGARRPSIRLSTRTEQSCCVFITGPHPAREAITIGLPSPIRSRTI